MKTDELQHELETLVDRAGILAVVDTLADVCFKKASCLETQWQDPGAAGVWHQVSTGLLSAHLSKATRALAEAYGQTDGV